jgi:glycerol kinase
MQMQTDLLNVEIDRPVCVETTALGAAYLAGLAVGVFSGPEAIANVHAIERVFRPEMSEEARSSHLRGWHDAVRRARTPA